MLKKIYLQIFICVFYLGFSFAQENNSLEVKELKLKNGLTVFLNEDNTQPTVYGAVVVKGGAKRDPKDATGIAHYLEHMFFKGTEDIGTVSYKKEKAYLDKISILYDKRKEAKTEKERDAILKEITDLTTKANEFAIPNEIDKILENMGCENVNAFTSHDAIVYFNSMPSNQIERWLEVYSNRFDKPVFRMFQSELEVVYEEKNISMDNPFEMAFEELSKRMYKVHPYGQQTVLGSVEHLKNPSLSKMYEFFKTYYVTNNMALVLSGNFKSKEIIPIIEKKFGKLRSGKVPKLPLWKEKEFNGREFFEVAMTPMNAGIIGFRTVKKGHKDEVILQVMNNVLSNSSGTGLLDKLITDGKIMQAGANSSLQIDMGSSMFIFIPRIMGQSLEEAEKLVMGKIKELKDGKFDDEFVNAIKVQLDKDFQRGFEKIQSRTLSIVFNFLEGKSWKEYLKYSKELSKVTKEDIIRIAKKYYGKNYLVMYSKMGRPDKKKLEKPKYKPKANLSNSEAKSDYFKSLDKIKIRSEEPKFISFSDANSKEVSDVKFKDISKLVHFYHKKNPINNVFTIRIKYGVGSREMPILKETASYLSYLGTEKKVFEKYKKELQKIGADIYMTCSDNYFSISVEGMDKYLKETLILLKEFLEKVKKDDSKIDILKSNSEMTLQTEDKTPNTVGRALMEYALYKKKSSFINRLVPSEISNLKGEKLLASFADVQTYEQDIHYVGKIPLKQVESILKNTLPLKKAMKKSKSPMSRKREKYKENTIYLLDDPNVVQSQVYMIVEGNPNNLKERAVSDAFNKYFGGGMSSLLFQEIREFRSLAYTTYGTYATPFFEKESGFTYGYVGTQADKTHEAIIVMNDILQKLPEKPERMGNIKNSLLQSVSTNAPSFRGVTNVVESWRKKGYKKDIRKEKMQTYKKMSFKDIVEFHKKNISKRPVLITIVGDKKLINLKEIKKLGKIIEVKKEEIFKK